MPDCPSVALQKVTFGLWSADAGVKKVLCNPPALYDKVPADVVADFIRGCGKTYVTIGDEDVTPKLYDDFEQTEHILHTNIWSQKIGMVEAKALAHHMSGVLIAAFSRQELVVPGYQVALCDRHAAKFARGEDGITTRGAFSMRLLISPQGD